MKTIGSICFLPSNTLTHCVAALKRKVDSVLCKELVRGTGRRSSLMEQTPPQLIPGQRWRTKMSWRIAFLLLAQQRLVSSESSQYSMLPRFINSTLLREWIEQILIVARAHLVIVSGKQVVQKVSLEQVNLSLITPGQTS